MNMRFDTFELSDIELESVYGGDGISGVPGVAGLGAGAPLGGPLGGGLLGGLGGSLGVASSRSAASSESVHSFSFTCDINTFSANIITGELKGILNIANCNTQICANRD
jgi:hypothetical protein